jgi:hypothetical protein
MPDERGNLYLFEAIELRNEYVRQIKLLQNLLEEPESKRERLFSKNDDEDKEPASGYDPKELEESLKKLKTKRVKLNQEIQIANLKSQFDYRGEQISLAEALEIRKNLLSDKDALAERVINSAYKRIIHKEERDIVREPKHPFKEIYEEFQDNLRRLRQMVNQIHIVNHTTTVNFKDE